MSPYLNRVQIELEAQRLGNAAFINKRRAGPTRHDIHDTPRLHSTVAETRRSCPLYSHSHFPLTLLGNCAALESLIRVPEVVIATSSRSRSSYHRRRHSDLGI